MRSLKILFIFLAIFGASPTWAQRGQPLSSLSYVRISTNLGDMIFRLSNETPSHTANFIKLVKKRYFDTYHFNRIIKGFVIQGGETDSAYAAMEKEGQTINRLPSEFSKQLFHQRGALAAGRDDNKEKASFLGQIYVVDGKKYTDEQLDGFEKRMGNNFHFSPNARKAYKEIGGTPSLDQNYTVFGQLVKGWEVLDLIAGQKKDKSDQPLVRVWMKVTLLSKKEAKITAAKY